MRPILCGRGWTGAARGARAGRNLLDELGAGDEHGQDAEADLGTNNDGHDNAVKDQANEADDDAKWRLIDVGEERRHDGLAEELDFVPNTSGNGGIGVSRRVCVPDNIKLIKVQRQEREQSQTLLIVEMAEYSWQGLLALACRKDLDEGMRSSGTRRKLVIVQSFRS